MTCAKGLWLRVLVVGVAAANVALLGGCGTTSSSGTIGGGGGTTGTAAGSVYVVQQPATGVNSILQFSATSSGTLTPASTLTTPSGFTATAVATDTGGQIYVGGLQAGAPMVLVYAPGASGAATPVRSISGGAGNFSTPASLIVDSAGLLYVLGNGTLPSVAVYSATATGNATPVREIIGTLTGLTDPLSIGVDAAGDIFVSNAALSASGQTVTGQILVFGPTATANVAPSRVITSSQVFYGIAVDTSANVYAVLDAPTGASTTSTATIAEYAAGASGAAAATKTIAGSATGLTFGGGLRRDAAGDVYVVNAAITATSATVSVLGFGPAATGNVAPATSFTSASWSSAGSELALK